ncbi:MAG: sigma-54 dependent transcriptional regulator [Blastocatellia bacterium]
MQNLLSPNFRRSVLGTDSAETARQNISTLAGEADENSLLDAQWYIITKTLNRLLGESELYEQLVKELARALNQDPLQAAGHEETSEEEFPLPGLVYRSAAMRELAQRIHKTRNSKLPVLITGEPGTGKEGIARAIHLLSDRQSGPFIAFNCTIVTKELISSQLFGHRKGSFTGADANYLGSIRVAQGGTLFLDEIGDLPLELQPKLLRFLQEGEVHPLGENKPVKVDVRVLAATNRDLEAMVQQGLFREDLYYRINILRFHLPPLRERREEIPPLAFHLLERFSAEAHKTGLTFTPEALARITTAEWPGNIRQLANEIQRAIALVTDEEAIYPQHLWPMNASETKRNGKRDWLDEILQAAPLPFAPPTAPTITEPAELPPHTGRPAIPGRTLAQEVDELEREIITQTLERVNYNLSQTARELGLTRRGLSLKMGRLRIDPKALKKARVPGAELA